MIINELEVLKLGLESGEYVTPGEVGPSALARNKRELQQELLRDTLDYCLEHVPYYHDKWSSLGLSTERLQVLEDLYHWPILRKQDVLSHRQELVSSAVRVVGYRCTSGTTAKRLPLPISDEEVQAIDSIGSLRVLVAKVEASDVAPIVLQVMPPVRRLAANAGGFGNGPVITTYLNLDAADQRFDFDYVDHVMQCLLETFPNNNGEDRVKVVWTCPSFMVRTLTEALVRRHFDFDSCDVQRLVCSGGTVTKAMCDYVNEHWGAQLTGFYSMAEVAGAHRRCQYSGRYEFDFKAYTEFLDPISQQPVPDGEEGVLVLTSLYPFQQAQPMVRYWTGDVFTVHRGEDDGRIAGTFRGREHECIELNDLVSEGARPRFLGSADVLEVLQRIPQLPQFHKSPKFFLATEHGADAPIVLYVETYPQSESRSAKLRKEIGQALALRLTNGVGAPFDPGYLDIRLVEKGTLHQHSAAYYPDR